VAAVGKTTLGRRLAQELGYPFADVDLTTVHETGKSIETLLAEVGGSGLNALLWQAYKKMLEARDRTIIVVSPRLLNRPSFWSLTRQHAMTIHVRSTPLKVLRRELAAEQAVPENEVVITKKMKTRHYRYYWWRLRHCQNADYEIRISGCLEKDVTELMAFLQAIQSQHE
jgi:shikimate kinase